MRGQMDEGMVPVSLLWSRVLQQWEDGVETMQREDDTDGVRFTSIITLIYASTARRQHETKRSRTYRSLRLVRFPRLAGMVPVSWLEPKFLQQWEHEVEAMQRKADKDEVRY
jgi:hypothetical protein